MKKNLLQKKLSAVGLGNFPAIDATAGRSDTATHHTEATDEEIGKRRGKIGTGFDGRSLCFLWGFPTVKQQL